MRSAPSLLPMLTLVLCAQAARAEPALDLRNFQPPTDPRGSLYLEPTSTPGPGAWNVGAVFSYAHRQIVLEDTSGRSFEPLRHQWSLDYLASVGIGDRLALGLSFPTVLYQTGDDIRPVAGDAELPRTAFGDAAFTAKATLLPAGELGGFGLAALARVTAPTGNSASYVGEDFVAGELRALAELRLIALTVQATAGARVRGQEQRYLERDFGHNLPWGAAVAFRPQVLGIDEKGRWIWTLEARGAAALTPAFASAAQSPALYGASARYTVGELSALAGVELPFNSAIGNPDVRVVAGIGWAPRFNDEDKDGVADEHDECPELAEDRDGFEDQDGCPDWDDDDDGVGDDDDRCPKSKETENEFQDDDGCPDKAPNETDAKPAQKPRCDNPVEDQDGFEDDDDCADPDNDNDGIADDDDACPLERGPHREDGKLDGCPSPDRDLDTIDDSEDQCPDKREDFDGDADEDGCPDDDARKPAAQRAKPLVSVEVHGKERQLRLRRPPGFLVTPNSVELDPKTVAVVRAIAAFLNENPSFIVLVGVRPLAKTPEAEQAALSKSFAVVHALRTFTHRDEAAESVGFAAVRNQLDANRIGIGFVVLAKADDAANAEPPSK